MGAYLNFKITDISILKEKDEIFVNGGWRKIETTYDDRLRILDGTTSYSRDYVENIAHLIEGYKKYIPKIRFDGAVCDIEAYVLDGGTLIYLETIGQESMVKSVTSVLMQGRVRMNEHSVDASFGYFDINKAGNRRKMISLNDGLAHAILYHSPSISDTNFSVLVGRNKEELLTSFSAWLEKSQPLPYPKELTKVIYTKLQDKEKLNELTSLNIEAIKVDLSLLEDECHDLQEIILEVCKENGLISHDAKPLKEQATLPNSPLLTEKQVQHIYDTLTKMPKTYELDGVDVKPIGLKLFTSSMTWYVVEADVGGSDDEFEGSQAQTFGYVKNEADEWCSEWGYINVDEVVRCGAEMDLHFDDMYIDTNGKVDILNNLIKKAA